MVKFLMLDPDHFWEKLEGLLKEQVKTTQQPKWLRSSQVKEMLNISDSTLQTLRINGILPAYKLGNSWYYKYEEIEKTLENGKIQKGGKNE